MSAVQHLTVTSAETDWRFDRWCKQHFPGVTHARLQKLLRTGQFRLDGKRADASDRLVTGQVIRVPPLDDEATVAAKQPARHRPSDYDASYLRSLILHQDDQVLVIAKPAGLAVQGGTGTTRHVDGLLETMRVGDERPRLVHRLDRETSGILVLAKTAPAAAFLTQAFREHRVRKLYWAVVMGRPERAESIIDKPLGKIGGAGRERMGVDEEDGKRAKTGFRVIAWGGKIGAWVGLMPETGRTHQLRAHCALIGNPIFGDRKYGARHAPESTAPKGLMLHAREIDVPHPRGNRLRLVAEPPKAFREGLAWLGLTPEPLAGSKLADWKER